ncbi:hypothetical protein ACFE04_027894 [Oxalis oulophora]
MSQAEVSRARPPLVPLATLIGRELRNNNVKADKPFVKYGQAALAKKGEDLFLILPDCQRIPGNPSTSFSVFAIFDGHNGISAAIFARENLLNNILSAIPQEANREEWLQALPRALVAGFVKTDIEFQQKGKPTKPTSCHYNVGPLRCWPGGLCLSRSIGDTDVGEYIVPIPHVKQVKLSDAGGRLIIASDGIWDTLSSDEAANACRGLPADLAATLVVKEALRSRGLKDDTTCVVVDIIPTDYPVLLPPTLRKKQKLSSLLFRKKFQNSSDKAANKLSAVGVVEELFEEGSAMLEERLGNPLNTNSGLQRCAVCQVDHPQTDSLSVDSGPFFSPALNTSDGPFLCTTCRRKKDAMEGKRPGTPVAT